MAANDNDSHALLYFLVTLALLAALVAVKNTYDIKWSLKYEVVQCK